MGDLAGAVLPKLFAEGTEAPQLTPHKPQPRGERFNGDVSLMNVFGRACRETRLSLDITQLALAEAVGISRSYLARIELGQVAISLQLVERIGTALGQRVELSIDPPRFVAHRRSHDEVHAWCVAAIARRLTTSGWLVAREVDASFAGVHGWIDLLAYHVETRTLIVIEVKTQLVDVGGMLRQIRWYERRAIDVAKERGWNPRRSTVWLLGLASSEVERAVLAERDLFADEFPIRPPSMFDVTGRAAPLARGLALIDPASRRRDWLLRTRMEGRRSALPYRHYADAARRRSR